MTYSIYNTSSSATYTITDGTVNIDTDLGLVGKGYLGYGPTINRNFLQLLENFSGATAPAKPIKGQLWYDSLNQAVKVYNGTSFSAISGSSLTATNISLNGDLTVSGNATFYGAVTLPALSGLTVNGTANITNVRGALAGPFNGTVGAITPNTGAFTTLTGTSGTFTTLTATTGYQGAANGPLNGTVGATTPNTGAFTTLSASTSITAGTIGIWAGNATITGVTLSGVSAGATGPLLGPHNGTVGATTPNTGAFTTLTATGTSNFAGTLNAATVNALNIGNTGATFTGTLNGPVNGPFNGTVGATTPNTGAFTTLSATNSIVVGTLGIWAGNATITGVTLSGVSAGATGVLNGPHNGTVGGITPNTGAFTTLTASTSISAGTIQLWAGNNTITGATISGQSSGATGTLLGPHNGTVGATTPNTGAFTTLTATSGYQGATSGDHNGTVGATVANTGSFTTLVTSGTIASTGNIVALATTSSTSATTGSLVVRGGAGIAGDIYCAGTIYGTVSGSITVNRINNTPIGDVTPSTGGFTVLTVNTNSAAVAIVNGGTNGIGDIGTNVKSFNTIYAKASTAAYADLAEMYVADATYEPGTVLDFGGAEEVTVSSNVRSKRVAGVVSTQPAYLMNSQAKGEFVVAVALTGRVPCKVRGPVAKGDLLVSAGEGYAMVDNDAVAGTIIGKAVQTNADGDGVVDVVVGRF
jgi:hypothetical protein